MSWQQYGFRTGRSTEDVIFDVRDTVEWALGKYVVGILYDATAAFENLWWPSIFRQLSLRQCPAHLAGLLFDCLQNRGEWHKWYTQRRLEGSLKRRLEKIIMTYCWIAICAKTAVHGKEPYPARGDPGRWSASWGGAVPVGPRRKARLGSQ